MTGVSLPTFLPALAVSVINFEDLQHLDYVTDHYASSYGVTFANWVQAMNYSILYSTSSYPGFAHSGTNGIEVCYAAEFCTAKIDATFTAGQAHLKVWVGFSSPLLD